MNQYRITITAQAEHANALKTSASQAFPGSQITVVNLTRQSRQERLQDAEGDANSAAATVRELSDEMQEQHDNMPDNLKDGERGERLSDVAGELSEIADTLESLDWPEVAG